MYLMRVWVPSEGLVEGAEQSLQWAGFDQKGTLLQQGAHLLAELPTANRYELCLPFDRVLLTSVTLPKQSRHQLLRVVPFALEDKLLSSPELSFCALGQPSGSLWPVAVVDKNWLVNVLAIFRASGRAVHAVWPGWNCLPVHSAVWLGHEGWLRNDKNQGVYLTEMPADDVVCFAGDEGAWRARNPDADAINLLQGSLAGQPKVAGAKNPWRWTAALALAVLLLTYGQLGWRVYQQKKEAKTLTTQINQNFYKVFPESATMVDPLLQLERKVQESSSGGSTLPPDDFLALMNKSAKLVAGHGSAAGVEYRAGELQLSLKLQASEVNALTTTALAAGLKVEPQSPEKLGDPIPLKIRAAGGGL